MTDDLLELLRSERSLVCAKAASHIILQDARIEQLAATNKELEAENKRLRLEVIHANDTTDAAIERVNELEAKLAKAVEFVECAINYAKTCGARFPMDEACTTLAELTGGKDD